MNKSKTLPKSGKIKNSIGVGQNQNLAKKKYLNFKI